ncbi:NAD(P)H-binding protein [Herbaspirillum frisingense]|uniref:NAD(P)H-binding protein n=1 Tax=Herbaspirillum frisingense TaxID=92645 RepID=UPI0016048502|nr:NAD(P)H-binding protein [Herbaspirillum frisingense]QNB06734.1 NAD(P)H-binding protein [Herbaspirillum frisingense]
MKFVVTGSAGNVSKPLATRLLKDGHEVTVIGRNADNLSGLVKLGALAAVGDLTDVEFLTRTFKGADGVYLMLPPGWNQPDLKKFSTDLAENFAAAIRATGVKNAVFLSSYGAHRLHDAGAISGMGLAEVVLNGLEGVNVLHLRAGYFYTNLLLSLGLIKSEGCMGNMFEIPAGTFTVVEPAAIADEAAEALTSQNFKGHSFRYVVSDESGTDEIAALIGKEIGIPDLKWVRFDDQQFKQVLLQYGFADGAADHYLEMFVALDRGVLFEDYVKTKPALRGISIEQFAKQFAEIYKK